MTFLHSVEDLVSYFYETVKATGRELPPTPSHAPSYVPLTVALTVS